MAEEVKPTPGPWEVEGWGGMHMNGLRDGYMVRVGGKRLVGPPLSRPDAILIAAAPEMLEALRWIAECGTDYQSICKAKGAIARAMEGGKNG